MFKLTAPVLFLVFNRLDTTKRVFAEIRKAKPKQLFIASDGPRKNKPDEKEIVEKVRKYVLNNVDWPCKVKTLFRKKNLGCKYSVSGAIGWFFENVEQGIILEDDCLPNQGFFRFCQEMLQKYKNEDEVMSISGYNYLENIHIKKTYYFSRYFECWGWATWKNRWGKCDIEFERYRSLKKDGKLGDYFRNWIERIIYKKRFEDTINKKGSWAYAFIWTHFLNSGCSIQPKSSLIKNLGFSKKDYTNTRDNIIDRKYFSTKVFPLDEKIIHPKNIKIDIKLANKYISKEIKRILFKQFIRR